MTRTREIKAHSDDVILRFVGEDERGAAGAPAADLTGNDIARLAYRRDLAEVTRDIGSPLDREDPDSALYERPDPRNPSAESIRAVLDELEASGRYEPVESKASKPAAPADGAGVPRGTEPADTGATPEG